MRTAAWPRRKPPSHCTLRAMPLLVEPSELASKLGLTWPLPDGQRIRLEHALEESEGKVEGFLNRSLVAEVEVVKGLVKHPDYEVTDKRAWPDLISYFDDRYRPISAEANDDDAELYDVTFHVGLDVANDPELKNIKTFIRQDAATALRTDPTFGLVTRAVTSVSAEGQSVQYEQGSKKPEEAGGTMTLNSLRRWKRKGIRQRVLPRQAPWPYASGYTR